MGQAKKQEMPRPQERKNDSKFPTQVIVVFIMLLFLVALIVCTPSHIQAPSVLPTLSFFLHSRPYHTRCIVVQASQPLPLSKLPMNASTQTLDPTVFSTSIFIILIHNHHIHPHPSVPPHPSLTSLPSSIPPPSLPHEGGIRNAPSNRITSPLIMGFSKIDCTSIANSFGSPSLFGRGTVLPSSFWTCSGNAANIGVRNNPGAIDTTLTPSLARSRARGRVRPATAALEAA